MAATDGAAAEVPSRTLTVPVASGGKVGAWVGSHGVVSMRHRIRALNGRLDIRSSASGGTVLLVQIPAPNALLAAAETPPI